MKRIVNVISTSFENRTPINLKILLTSSGLETTLKQNIQDTKLFSDPKFQPTIANKSESSKYQYEINVSVILNKGVAQ